MKLFVGAYEAAASFPVAMYLYTEEDMRIEASRKEKLRYRDADRLLKFIETCDLYSRYSSEMDIFICVDLDYQGQRRRRFDNLSDKTADKFLEEGEL